MAELNIEYRVFFTQKRGNERYHYEDAFALDGVSHPDIEGSSPFTAQISVIQPDAPVWRCALADGTTQGGYSKLWAQMLVDRFIYHTESAQHYPPLKPDFSDVREWLLQLSNEWHDRVIDTILETIPPNSARRSRVQQSLLLEGQAATLVLFEADVQNRIWRTGMIGDSLIFHYRGDQYGNGQILPGRPAPDLRWDQMDTNPILVSSTANNQQAWIWDNRYFTPTKMFYEASFEADDVFILMTDAIGKWFLRILNSGDSSTIQNALHTLFSFQDNQQFIDWVSAGRSLEADDPERLVNDDTTLLMIRPTRTGAVGRVTAIPPRGVPAPRPKPNSPPPISQPVAVNPASTETQDEDDIYRPNRAVTVPAAAHTDTLPQFEQAALQNVPPVIQPVEPAFQPIEAQFDDPPAIMFGQWVNSIKDLLKQRIDDDQLRAFIAQEYNTYKSHLSEWFTINSSRKKEFATSLTDFRNGHINRKQFAIYIHLSDQHSKTRLCLISEDNDDRKRKQVIKNALEEIERVSDEYIMQWCDRNRNQKRHQFIKLMNEFKRKQDLKALKQFFRQ